MWFVPQKMKNSDSNTEERWQKNISLTNLASQGDEFSVPILPDKATLAP